MLRNSTLSKRWGRKRFFVLMRIALWCWKCSCRVSQRVCVLVCVVLYVCVVYVCSACFSMSLRGSADRVVCSRVFLRLRVCVCVWRCGVAICLHLFLRVVYSVFSQDTEFFRFPHKKECGYFWCYFWTKKSVRLRHLAFPTKWPFAATDFIPRWLFTAMVSHIWAEVQLFQGRRKMLPEVESPLPISEFISWQS